jgi:hypothetical protein
MDSAAKSYLIAVVLFNLQKESTPLNLWLATSWWPMTCCVHMWHLLPSPTTLQALPPSYMPTDLQSSTEHPRVIDLVWFPGLRNRLIQTYSHDRELDRVYLDLVDHIVINVSDISTVIAGAEPGPGFLGVCNIFQAMSSGGRRGDSKSINPIYTQGTVQLSDVSLHGLLQAYKMTVPNLSHVGKNMCLPGNGWTPLPLMEILTSAVLAQRLYYHLDLYAAHETWRVDPQFYEKHPDLRWDSYEETVAVGASYRVTTQWFQPKSTGSVYM